MAVSDNYTPTKTIGNGSTVAFTASWNVIAASNMRVYLENVATGVQVLQVKDTDYSLSFNESGLTVDFSISSAPPATEYVVLARSIAQDQIVPFKTSQGFQGAVTENSFDKVISITQDIQDQIDRSLKFPIASGKVGTLPSPVDGYGLIWDGTDGDVRNTTSSLSNLEGAAEIVSANIANVNTVAGISSNITTVSGMTSDISTVVSNIVDIQNAEENALAAAASAALVPLSKYNATTSPTVNDDSGDGYGVGSLWVDVTNDRKYICVDSTLTAAVWQIIPQEGYYNALDYAIPRDGVTNAATSLQALIDAVNAAGGGTIFMPTGQYKVNTSILVPQGVYLRGAGSRQTRIIWGNADATNFTKGVVYSVKGTDGAPGFVFSTGLSCLNISANDVVDVALALRGQQEDCIYEDLVLSGFKVAGLDVLAFSSVNHGITFSDLHILPDSTATGAYGVRAANITKCHFKNITTDIVSGSYARGFSLTSAVQNIFEGIHTEDCTYGFHVSSGSGNNVYIGLEAYRGSGTSTTHFHTTETRYSIHSIRTRTGFTNHIDDGTNVITAGTDEDSVVVERGNSYFRRLKDSETYTATRPGFIRGDRQVYAGVSGNGQAIFRTNTTIAISGTKEIIIDVGTVSKGFAGKLTLFSTGAQRYCTEVFFEGFVSTGGTVSGGVVSAQVGSTTTRVTIAAPAAVAAGAVAQQFGMVITNASGAFTQVLEVKLEITRQDGQCSTMSIV